MNSLLLLEIEFGYTFSSSLYKEKTMLSYIVFIFLFGQKKAEKFP